MVDGAVRAMVQTGPNEVALQELARPELGRDEALIRVEACGICGSDIVMFHAPVPGFFEFPVIRGHEPVGTIEAVGPGFAARTGHAVGDRVAVDPFLRCGICDHCLGGHGELCQGDPQRRHNNYSMIPLHEGSGLWGGFATHLVATGNTVLYPVPAEVPPTRAALFNALGAGVKWTADVGGATLGSTVVVLGCGQRGLACATVAMEVGASFVAVTGLSTDAHKLDIARELGVDAAIDIGVENPVEAIAARFPDGVDLVIDTTPKTPSAVADAISMVRIGGTIVLAGMKHERADVPVDVLVRKEITVRGVLGTGADHYRRAIAMIARSSRPLDRLTTHVLPLEEVERGIQLLEGRVPGEHALAVVISPDASAVRG